MSDDDKWVAAATGGYNPATGEMRLLITTEGSSIEIVIEDCRSMESLQRINEMIETLPDTFKTVLTGLTREMMGITQEADPDKPKPTIYRVE